MHTIGGESLDKLNTFIEINANSWKTPNKISVEELLSQVKHEKFSKEIDGSTLVLDENIQKIKVNEDLLFSPSVFSEPFDNQNIDYNKPPEDASVITGMHLMVDDNYLYIWVKNRWKRIPLSEY